jgi:hypothetical protein
MEIIDAALFTGDEFHDLETRAELRRMLQRWNRRVTEISRSEGVIGEGTITVEEIVEVLDVHRPRWVTEFCSVSDANDVVYGHITMDRLRSRMMDGMLHTIAHAILTAQACKGAPGPSPGLISALMKNGAGR